MSPTFFQTPADFRQWLEKHATEAAELWVGFYKRGTGRQSITWPEAVDQALCFGWIDAIRKGIDEKSYMIRFVPRKPNSIWSAVNVHRVEELKKLGLVTPDGLEAFAKRKEEKTAIYAYEKQSQDLEPAMEAEFRKHNEAWDYFSAQAPWYRRNAIHWVVGAKREETRQKRLQELIRCSVEGRWLPQYTRY